MIVFKTFMCFLILIMAPFMVGVGITSLFKSGQRSFGVTMLFGYMLMFISFELVTVPVLLTTQYDNFTYVWYIYTPILCVLSAFGVFTYIKKYSSRGIKEFGNSLFGIYRAYDADTKTSMAAKAEYYGAWIIVAVILVFLLIMSQTTVIFDGDDAYYVTQSLITQQNGAMYVTLPYTGGACPLDIRHAMAVFTMWITYVGKLTGIHTTIICHTILPLVLIPLTLMTYIEAGVRLLKDKKDMLPFFGVFAELLILFGRISIYTAETFLTSRTWQGKSLAANVLIPAAFLAVMIMFEEKDRSSLIPVLLVDMTAGIFSSLAVMLVSILIAVSGIWYGIYTKSLKKTVGVYLCLIPGAIYMVLYVYFTYVAW